MCSGRVDLAFILRAFSNGMDGVFIGACRLNECNYSTHGNYDALGMVQLCKKIMEHIGLNPQRVRIEFMSSGEGILFTEVMNDFGRRVRALGALGTSEGIDKSELKSKLEAVTKLIPYIKLAKREKLALRLDKAEDYNEFFGSEEIDRLFREVPSYHIDADTCRACMICLRRCPAGAIAGGKNEIHAIEQEKCIKCGTCFEACPPRFGAVRKTCGESVSMPTPQEKK